MSDLSHIRMSKRDRELAEELLSKMPSKGTIGNSNLRNRLSWKDQRYWRIRAALIAYGFITTGKGHGGSVMLVTKSSEKDTQDHDASLVEHSFADLDEQDQKLAKELLKKVPQDGAKIGNSSLRAELDWKDDRYWRIRNTLIDYGLLETGKGKGGSVGRISSTAQGRKDDGKEKHIYSAIEKMLYEWARDQGYTEKKDILITKTAYQKKGGRWTNPDFVAAGFRSLPYIHGNQIDLFSFEIKRGWADATSVYEAVAHQRFVNYAYLLVAEPNESVDLSTLEDIAYGQGIGLITAKDTKYYDTWEELVSPKRNVPDPFDMNHFIEQCPWDFQQKWRCWIEIPSDEDGSGLR